MGLRQERSESGPDKVKARCVDSSLAESESGEAKTRPISKRRIDFAPMRAFFPRAWRRPGRRVDRLILVHGIFDAEKLRRGLLGEVKSVEVFADEGEGTGFGKALGDERSTEGR